jgi:hypothetical protein
MIHKSSELHRLFFVREGRRFLSTVHRTVHETFDCRDGVVPWKDYGHGFHGDPQRIFEICHMLQVAVALVNVDGMVAFRQS